MKIINICGARPNFMKIAPLMRAYKSHAKIEPLLVHTGQHYDKNMSDLFFKQLEIPEPDMNLEVGSGSHAEQTAEIMKRFEPVVLEQKPDWVLVVGDVNSTIACGLVAKKLGVRLAHVEAGLRSFDRGMPEEINRVLTDAISDLLFVSEPSGLENLRKEGADESRVHFVGNVMIDTLLRNREKAEKSTILTDLGVAPKTYAVVTLHRPSNVDDPALFGTILDGLGEIGSEMQIVFPMHPRTRANVRRMGLEDRLNSIPGIKIPEPLGYLDFLKLMSESALVMTDSGGMQEETTILGVPCLTLRENTERPVTISEGTNRLVELSREAIVSNYRDAMSRDRSGVAKAPELWDGKAAERIVGVLAGV